MKKQFVVWWAILGFILTAAGCAKHLAEEEPFAYSIVQMTDCALSDGELPDGLHIDNEQLTYEPLTEVPLDGLTYLYTYHAWDAEDCTQWAYTYTDEDGHTYRFDVMGRLTGWNRGDTANRWDLDNVTKKTMRSGADTVMHDLGISVGEVQTASYDMTKQGMTVSWCCTTELTPEITLRGDEGSCSVCYADYSGMALNVSVEYAGECNSSSADRETFDQLLREKLKTSDHVAEEVYYRQNGDIHALFVVEIEQEDGSTGTECYVAAKTKIEA